MERFLCGIIAVLLVTSCGSKEQSGRLKLQEISGDEKQIQIELRKEPTGFVLKLRHEEDVDSLALKILSTTMENRRLVVFTLESEKRHHEFLISAKSKSPAKSVMKFLDQEIHFYGKCMDESCEKVRACYFNKRIFSPRHNLCLSAHDYEISDDEYKIKRGIYFEDVEETENKDIFEATCNTQGVKCHDV